jgi:hypothetical protein
MGFSSGEGARFYASGGERASATGPQAAEIRLATPS